MQFKPKYSPRVYGVPGHGDESPPIHALGVCTVYPIRMVPAGGRELVSLVLRVWALLLNVRCERGAVCRVTLSLDEDFSSATREAISVGEIPCQRNITIIDDRQCWKSYALQLDSRSGQNRLIPGTKTFRQVCRAVMDAQRRRVELNRYRVQR